jgi:competence protein ComEA
MQLTGSFQRPRLWLLAAVLFLTLTLNTAVAQSQSKGKHRVDVNSADVKTLETLPGITPTLADRIVQGRPYKNMSDLAKVKGLTSTKLDAIKDGITFGSGTKKSAKSSKKTPSSDVTSQETSSTPTKQKSSAATQPTKEKSSAATEPATATQNTHTAPTKSPTPTGSSTGHLAPGQTVNINTATLEELDALPGIGPSKAQAIIDYRNEHGRFNSIEDIQNVKGIKEGEFSKLKDYIRVR